MISYIKGIIENIVDNFVILENNGIGYKIFVSDIFLENIKNFSKERKYIQIFTYMNIKDDNITLYGFEKIEELEFFNKLIAVAGIGPKGALNILSNINLNEFINAIILEDINTILKAPGVGRKTAQRIIIELKDKLDDNNIELRLEDTNNNVIDNINNKVNIKFEVIEALCVLGYSRNKALKIVSDVYFEGGTTEEILKIALKKI